MLIMLLPNTDLITIQHSARNKVFLYIVYYFPKDYTSKHYCQPTTKQNYFRNYLKKVHHALKVPALHSS